MQSKLEKALTKVFNPAANDIVKGLRKDAGQIENYIPRKQEMTMSKGLMGNSSQESQNFDPNRDISGYLTQQQTQQNVWAEELRRADERALKFKGDLVEADTRRVEMDRRIKELEKAITARD